MLIEYLRQDFRANAGNSKGLFIVVAFRLANVAGVTKNVIFRVIGKLPVFIYKILINWILCVELDYKIKAGPGLRVFHGQGLVVNGDTVLGSNVTLRHNTTIGNRVAGGRSPVIEEGVDIGANSVIIGALNVGKNAVIGAGSVVVAGVPVSVVGNPACLVC